MNSIWTIARKELNDSLKSLADCHRLSVRDACRGHRLVWCRSIRPGGLCIHPSDNCQPRQSRYFPDPADCSVTGV